MGDEGLRHSKSAPVLVCLIGPTGVGKTQLGLALAERWQCPIVNADSRQIYREIPIGTAAPTHEEQARAKHYFVGTHTLDDDYNAGQYERDCVALLTQLQTGAPAGKPFAILTGGSMLYIDAVCKGLDDIPSADSTLRKALQEAYQQNGLAWLQEEVQKADPAYWAEVDRQNPQRLLHCLEVCRVTGQPFSAFRRHQQAAERPWKTLKIGLTRPRDVLYSRINRRVDMMMEKGLLEEVKSVVTWRQKNSLNTVGYKELFRYLDGELSLDAAVDLIREDSRHYAKRQLTWWRRDTQIHWIEAEQTQEQTIQQIENLLQNED